MTNQRRVVVRVCRAIVIWKAVESIVDLSDAAITKIKTKRRLKKLKNVNENIIGL